MQATAAETPPIPPDLDPDIAYIAQQLSNPGQPQEPDRPFTLPTEEPPAPPEPQTPEEPADGPPEPEGKEHKTPQFRLRPKNDFEEAVFRELRADPEMTLDKAQALARVRLGLPDPAAPPPDAVQQPEQPAPRDIQAEIDAAIERQSQALENFDTETAKAATREITRLQTELAEQRISAKFEEQSRSNLEQMNFNQSWDAAKMAAVKSWPQSTDQSSALYKEIANLDQILRESKAPITDQPDYPLRVVEMAARKLGIPPKSTGSPPSRPPVQTPQAPIAGGQARSTSQALPADAAAILDRDYLPHEWDAMKRKLLGNQR